jgi:hypothetical protein
VNVRDEAMARRRPSMGSFEVSGIAVLTLGLGMFVLGASPLAVVPLVVLSASLVAVGRASARGWSHERLGVTAAIFVGALLVELVGWAVAGLVGVLVVSFGALLAWHLDVGPRTRNL